MRDDLVSPEGAGRTPSDLELLARTAVGGLRSPERLVRYGSGLARRAVSVLGVTGGHVEAPPMGGLPRAPWNHDIGPRRSYAFTSFALQDLRAVKHIVGVTFNDVVLAVAAGALRAHLGELGVHPRASLVASVPMSTRANGDNGLDNQLANMMVRLHTDEPDPVARLLAIHHSADTAKAVMAAVRSTTIPSLGEIFTPAMLRLVFRTLHRTRALEHLPVMANLVVSNVAGPTVPLYLAGARMTAGFSGSVILDGMGLNITAVSYAGRVDVSVGVDPELVPDPWPITGLLEDSLAELMSAAGVGAPTTVPDTAGRGPAL